MSSVDRAVGRKRGLQSLSFLRGDKPSIERHLDWLRCAERLTKDDCKEIIEVCREFPLTPPSTVGEDRYPAHRQADTRKVGVNPSTQWIFDLLCKVAAEASRVASGLALTEITRAPQYVEYRKDWGRFDWHNDYSHGIPHAPRKLTIIIQLSPADEYEGGRLQVFGTEVEDLPSEMGTIVAFPSFLYHRVTPVTLGVRRALVAWIAGPRIC
jgi:PKHD-type hydroxylase